MAQGNITPGTEIAVRCRNLVVDLGTGAARTRVLSGLDLDIRYGELTILMGPSGCGKTTLMSLLAGILRPDAGELEVLATPISKLSAASAAGFRATNVGFVMQQFNLLPALTAVENVTLPLLAQKSAGRRADARAAEILERLDLSTHLQKFPSELSMGQQQRVAIARALVHEPRLIICDEPTAALDAASGAAVMQLLRAEAVKPGRAVIVVTHDHRILPCADSVAHMSDGQIKTVERPGIQEAA